MIPRASQVSFPSHFQPAITYDTCLGSFTVLTILSCYYTFWKSQEGIMSSVSILFVLPWRICVLSERLWTWVVDISSQLVLPVQGLHAALSIVIHQVYTFAILLLQLHVLSSSFALWLHLLEWLKSHSLVIEMRCCFRGPLSMSRGAKAKSHSYITTTDQDCSQEGCCTLVEMRRQGYSYLYWIGD